MNDHKLPALQFYPGDWRKDPGIQALTFEERGVWLELLFMMFESDRRGFLTLNGHPMDDQMIGKILGIHGNKWKKIKRKLEVTGVASIEEKEGTLYNRRMVRDEEIRQKRIFCGRLGGNPLFIKGKSNPYFGYPKDNLDHNQDGMPKITPSVSSSSSYSDTTTTPQAAPNGLRDCSVESNWNVYVKEFRKLKSRIPIRSNERLQEIHKALAEIREESEAAWVCRKFLTDPDKYLKSKKHAAFLFAERIEGYRDEYQTFLGKKKSGEAQKLGEINVKACEQIVYRNADKFK